MSEQQQTRQELYTRFAADFGTAIREQEQDAREFANSHVAQTFLDVFDDGHETLDIYAYEGDAAWNYGSRFSMAPDRQEAALGAVHYAASVAGTLRSTILEDQVFDSYVKQGPQKLTDAYFRRCKASGDALNDPEQFDFQTGLPVALLLLAAIRKIDPDRSDEFSVDAARAVDEQVQSACRTIVMNKKVMPDSQRAEDVQFANMMNCVRQLFSLQGSTYDNLVVDLMPLYMPMAAIEDSTPSTYWVLKRYDFANRRLCEFLHVLPSSDPPSWVIARAQARVAMARDSGREWTPIGSKAYAQVRALRAARSAVAMFAEGQSITSLLVGASILNENVLKSRVLRKEAREEKLRFIGWEPLRRGPRADTRHIERAVQDDQQNQSGVVLDEVRLDWLEELGRQWGDDWYVVRRTLSGGKRKTPIPGDHDPGYKGYYVLVLPQRLANGAVIEHAVADSRVVGGKAVYMYRGELSEEHGITWQHVFDGSRARARDLGAVRVNHIDDYRFRVLDRLTEPLETTKKRIRHIGLHAMLGMREQ